MGAMNPSVVQPDSQLRSGCGLQPNVAAFRGYVGIYGDHLLVNRQSGCVTVGAQAATALRLLIELAMFPRLPRNAATLGWRPQPLRG